MLSNQQLLTTYMRETPSLWITGGLALEAGAGRGMNAVGLSAAVAASAVTSSTVAVEALDLMFMRLVQMTETGDERSFEVGEGRVTREATRSGYLTDSCVVGDPNRSIVRGESAGV